MKYYDVPVKEILTVEAFMVSEEYMSKVKGHHSQAWMFIMKPFFYAEPIEDSSDGLFLSLEFLIDGYLFDPYLDGRVEPSGTPFTLERASELFSQSQRWLAPGGLHYVKARLLVHEYEPEDESVFQVECVKELYHTGRGSGVQGAEDHSNRGNTVFSGKECHRTVVEREGLDPNTAWKVAL